MPITIADVASRAGVSKTTVSRVLNGKGELDASTAARVRQVIAELGYVPSSRAVGLARGRTSIVGVLVPSVTWPWIGDVMQAIIDTVEAHSYGLLMFTCNRGDESMRQFATHVSAKSFDGLIVIEPEGTLDYIVGLHEKGLPVVMIDDRGHEPPFPSVATTNRAGARSAAEHLLAIGRRKPVVVHGELRFECTTERLEGFREVFEAAGHPISPEAVVEGEFRYETGRDAVRHLLDTGVDFDCVFAHNDLSAAGAMQALRDAGAKVPDDVSVVGFDDIPLASYTDPPLTTVRQPLREMGELATQMLLSCFEGPVASRGRPLGDTRRVIDTSLVVRSSSVPI
jgi:LacI family transcriptional regulator